MNIKLTTDSNLDNPDSVQEPGQVGQYWTMLGITGKDRGISEMIGKDWGRLGNIGPR